MLETLISVAVLCVAIVLSAEELKPVSWRVWAGKVERERHKRKPVEELLSGKVQAEEGYEWLEDGHRKGFLDIRVSINGLSFSQCRVTPGTDGVF